MNALIAANQTPDVFICNPGPNLTQYVEAGIATDLNSILNGAEKDWYDTFADGIFDKITYDGKIMAIPTNFAAACVFYKTDIFAAAGARVPSTYAEMVEVCAKLEAAGSPQISC